MKFTLMNTDGMARRGEIETPRGTIRTPAFMPVGTAATVKAMYPDQVRELGADIVLGNTYHLMLRPGAEEVAALGGLQDFMQWDGPIITDSGGFQVMSLSKLAKMSEDGVRFQSHLDGSEHMLTPERSIEIQSLLGANIRMVLDECSPFPASHEQAEASMQLSMRWAERSKKAFGEYDAGRAMRCSALCRAAFMKICAIKALPLCKISALTVTLSAAWRLVRGMTPCCKCWISLRRFCRKTNRAISWGGHAGRFG